LSLLHVLLLLLLTAPLVCLVRVVFARAAAADNAWLMHVLP
jgi:hypothetical protein